MYKLIPGSEGYLINEKLQKARNILTGKVVHFPSMSELCKYIKRSRINLVTTPIGKDKIFTTSTGKWDIREETDNRPWPESYEDEVLVYKTYQITFIINGKVNIFKDIISLNKFAQTPKMIYNLNELCIYIKNLYNVEYSEIIIGETHDRPNIIAVNIETDDYIYTDNRKNIIESLEISQSSIDKSLMYNGKYAYKGWKFKYDNGEDFEVLYTPTNAPQTIVITNVITNEVIEFNSLRKASEYLNIDKKIIKKLIQTKRLFKNIYSLKNKNTGLPVE